MAGSLRQLARGFGEAVGFLTALPLGGCAGFGPSAVPFFAWVGAFVGLIEGGAFLLLAVHLGRLTASAFVLLLDLLLTRGLHWDGLLDTADGLAVLPREKALSAMRDPRIGAQGALFGAAFLGLRLLLPAATPAEAVLASFALAPALARLALALAVVAFPYARPEGLGSALVRSSPFLFLPNLLPILALAALVPERARVLAAMGVALAGTLAAGAFVRRRFGGFTGDVYGALTVATEIAVFAVFAWR